MFKGPAKEQSILPVLWAGFCWCVACVCMCVNVFDMLAWVCFHDDNYFALPVFVFIVLHCVGEQISCLASLDPLCTVV